MELDVPFEEKNSPKREVLKRLNGIKGCKIEHRFSDHYNLVKNIETKSLIEIFKRFFSGHNDIIGEVDIREGLTYEGNIEELKVDIIMKEEGKEFIEQIMNVLVGLEKDFEKIIKISIHADFKHPMFDKIKCAEEL